MSNTCPQCAIFSEAINQIVANNKIEREEEFTKCALDEVKLMNIVSYARLIGAALERSGSGTCYNLPTDWRVISGQSWNDIQVMLFHIEDTLVSLVEVEA